MRDKYIQVINNGLSDIFSAIPKMQAGIDASIPEDRKESLKRLMVFSLLEATIGTYSTGNSKDVVNQRLLIAIGAFASYFKWLGFERGYGQYDQMLWMVSLSILCDVSEDDFKAVTDVLKRDGANDKLLSFLIKSKRSDWEDSNATVIQQSPYAIAGEIASETDEETGIAAIKSYLENDWYKGNDDAPWHDSHNNKKVDSYFGYWAWETAAIVKAKGWNDEKLKGVKYYPYDAVHW
jgi:hypothetical protein